MRVNAYVLAGDPAWLEASIRSYYPVVDRIVVCYDAGSIGWSGQPIPVDACLDRARAVDPDRKVTLLPGSFYRVGSSPMENDTAQRRAALAEAGRGADWVLMLDTDEILPDAGAVVTTLRGVPPDRAAVEWPMRPFFNRMPDGRFLEVRTFARRPVSEYPGPIAVRPGTRLTYARAGDARPWRVDVRPRSYDRIDRRWRPVDAVVPAGQAVVHLSWVRSEQEMRRKVRGWSHGHEFDGDRFLDRVWLPAARRWWRTYNFHPVWPRLWPALWPVRLPSHLSPPTATPGDAVTSEAVARPSPGPRPTPVRP
ncbi:MAG TPA: hypothetical protein VF796_07975 [Humisphaera sp.]